MRADVLVNRSIDILARMAALGRAMKMAWARRKLLGELGSLDDHLLRDMGITRQDIASVLAEPGLEDPTLRLAARAREARRGQRATALEERRWAAMLSETERPAATGRDSRTA